MPFEMLITLLKLDNDSGLKTFWYALTRNFSNFIIKFLGILCLSINSVHEFFMYECLWLKYIQIMIKTLTGGLKVYTSIHPVTEM